MNMFFVLLLVLSLSCQKKETDDLDVDGVPFRIKELCSKFESRFDSAKKELHDLNDHSRWEHFSGFLKEYGECIDGGHAVMVSTETEVALAKDWDAFVTHVETTKPNHKLLAHLLLGYAGDRGSPELQEKIRTHAARLCPERMKEKICPMMVRKEDILFELQAGKL